MNGLHSFSPEIPELALRAAQTLFTRWGYHKFSINENKTMSYGFDFENLMHNATMNEDDWTYWASAEAKQNKPDKATLEEIRAMFHE